MCSQFFSVYTQTLKFDWKSSFPSGFWTQGPWGLPQAAVSEWPLGPAWTLREAALYMLWMVTKIAPQKDSRKKTGLFRTDWCAFPFSLHPCFHDLVRGYHWQGERALDRNPGDGLKGRAATFLFKQSWQVPGLSFSICKMRGWFSTIVTVPLFVHVCVHVYIYIHICVCVWG